MTKQSKLGRIGDRWGCLATCIINIIENERGKDFDKFDLAAAVGWWFMHETSVALSNYKDHTRVRDELGGWSAKADPEWHYFVLNREGALSELMGLFGVSELVHEYEIVEIRTQYGSHFVLRIDQAEIVNPDPMLTGQEVESKPIRG